MNLEKVKLLYVISISILSLIILLPILFTHIPFPDGERFSELWLLGSNHIIKSESFTVSLNTSYTVYVGAGNHLSDFEYYAIYVKLRNESQVLEETASGLHNPEDSIFDYRLFLRNNETWEKEFTFSFRNVKFEESIARVSKISVNNVDINTDTILKKDNISGEFPCQLLFELWIYNNLLSKFQYHNRSVWFWINLPEIS